MKRFTWYCLALVVLLMLPAQATAQSIGGYVSVNVPTDICAGSGKRLTFGYGSGNSVVFDIPSASQNRAQRAFLPDGVSCPPYGCKYRSSLTFSGFEEGQTVQSVQDIKYVKLNMEHSYIGDVYIGVVCPNGQKASLMNWSGHGSSDCDEEVPAGCTSWASGNNVDGSTYLGEAYDYTDYYNYCDSTRPNNAPGTGWDYCWSSNTTSGYQYGSGDGRIYRAGNRNGYSIKASNAAQGRQFYKPDQSFASLVGCPLNGTWYIEVVDAYSQDNGWIFDWELSLNPALLPSNCALESRTVISPYVTRQNDSTYMFNAPAGLTVDTTVEVLFRLVNTCGDTLDTVAMIRMHPKYNITEYDTACDSYTLHGHTYTADAVVTKRLQSLYGCDSTMRYRLHIVHADSAWVSDTVVENSLDSIWRPLVGSGTFWDTAWTDLLTTTAGCDSTVHNSLHVWLNVADTVDSTLCRNQLPIEWNGLNVDDAGLWDVKLFASHGADSVVTLRLALNADDLVSAPDTALENNLDSTWRLPVGSALSWDTAWTESLFNLSGCDSIVNHSLHVWLNRTDTVDSTVCRHILPVQWNGQTFSDSDTVTLLNTDIHGADSVTVMILNVNEDSRGASSDTIVENELDGRWPFAVGGTEYWDTAWSAVLTNSVGCDSTVDYRLHVWLNTASATDSTVCHHLLPLLWNGVSFTAASTRQAVLANQHGADSLVTMTLRVVYDSRTDSFDTVCLSSLPYPWQGQLLEYAEKPVIYAADTLKTVYGCDSILSLRLSIRGEYLLARPHVTPTVVTLDDLRMEFFDNSRDATAREWTVGDYVTSQQSFTYTYPSDYDSLTAVLVASNGEGCTDTATILLQLDRSAVLVPNTFTPSLETNNRWFLATQDLIYLEVWIYNRQGNLVAHLNGVDSQWDGRNLSGEDCPQDSYVYKALYRTRVRPDRLQDKFGTILLLR